MTDTAVATAAPDERRQVALLKAVGLDRLAPEQRELALNLARRYELDLLLKHLVLIEGRAYVTRDGLLHIAHRSGVFDGMEASEPVLDGEFWRATCSVYRRDMSRPFTYPGRYPSKGGNQKYAPEMATKVAEVAALRRAFDVSAPTAEERWDEAADVPPPTPKPTLDDRIAQRRAAIVAPPPAPPEPEPEPLDVEEEYVEAIVDAILDDEAADVEAEARFRAAAKAAGLTAGRVNTAAHQTYPGVSFPADYHAAHWSGLASALLIEL